MLHLYFTDDLIKEWTHVKTDSKYVSEICFLYKAEVVIEGSCEVAKAWALRFCVLHALHPDTSLRPALLPRCHHGLLH